jgi:hypothetical protein
MEDTVNKCEKRLAELGKEAKAAVEQGRAEEAKAASEEAYHRLEVKSSMLSDPGKVDIEMSGGLLILAINEAMEQLKSLSLATDANAQLMDQMQGHKHIVQSGYQKSASTLTNVATAAATVTNNNGNQDNGGGGGDPLTSPPSNSTSSVLKDKIDTNKIINDVLAPFSSYLEKVVKQSIPYKLPRLRRGKGVEGERKETAYKLAEEFDFDTASSPRHGTEYPFGAGSGTSPRQSSLVVEKRCIGDVKKIEPVEDLNQFQPMSPRRSGGGSRSGKLTKRGGGEGRRRRRMIIPGDRGESVSSLDSEEDDVEIGSRDASQQSNDGGGCASDVVAVPRKTAPAGGLTEPVCESQHPPGLSSLVAILDDIEKEEEVRKGDVDVLI